ncbi:Na+/H+ antiporter NhaD/arsenite permease-like protein [Streptomyces sp. SAI-090]|nr:Na+/H+ antiporter NhaD/arsenite permease-like protein [Streptomyces sp. SAI-090]
MPPVRPARPVQRQAKGKPVIFLVAALLLLGVLLGSVAHLPVPVSLLAAAVIGGWLLVFAVRQRHARRQHH